MLSLLETPLNGYENYIKEKNKQNLGGWQGILFYCASEGESAPLRNICEKSANNAEFLAATSKVNLVKAKHAIEVGFRSVVDDFIILEVALHATESPTPSAIHAEVKAYVGYSKVIDQSPIQKKSPRANPRSGDLVFWERFAIGAGVGVKQDLISPMTEAIEQILKAFFTDYLNARN